MTYQSAFFYGSLMSSVILIRVLCGENATEEEKSKKLRSLHSKSVILKGYKRSSVKDEDYPAILCTGNLNDEVQGMYVEGFTKDDVKALDIFEGDEYERRPVQVQVQAKSEEPISTEAYVWIADPQLLTGEDWSLECFRLTGKERKWLTNSNEFDDVDTLHQQS